MQKKMVGIIASVAAAHAVLAIALMTGGGCRQPKILAPHTYNDGPTVAGVPAATDNDVKPGSELVPPIAAGEPPIAPVEPPVVRTQKAPVPVPPVSGGVKTYKVKKGDTISGIAFRYGIRIRDLAACNNLSGKAINNIRIGQVLTIPDGAVYDENRKVKRSKKSAVKSRKNSRKAKKSVKPAALPADGIYVVKSGDSLDRIGRRYGVTAKAIAKENNIALTKILQIGDKLRIPGKAAASAGNDSSRTSNTLPAEQSVSNISNDNVLDGLDPNAGLDNAANTGAGSAAGTADPAGNNAAAPAKTEPAAAVDSAAPAAPAAPAAEGSKDSELSGKTDSVEVISDMSVEEFAKRNMVSAEVLRKLNPNIPADGQLKGGTFLSVPSLD